MARASFYRQDSTTIHYSISGGYTGTHYTYAVQVQSNGSGNWITKTYASISSSGSASGSVTVNDNSGYYCRIVEYYDDTVSAYLPSSSGAYVAPYDPGPVYSGTISLYDSGGYNYNTSYPYQGYIEVRVVLSSGAGTGWRIRVNNSGTNVQYISSSGIYRVTLDNLYNPSAANYHVNLEDPDGDTQDYVVIPTRETPYTTHTLFLLANGGSGAPDPVSETVIACYQNVPLRIPSGTPTRAGYEFLGWSSSQTATSPTYYPLDSVNVSGQRTLYAVWSERRTYQYTVTYVQYSGSSLRTTRQTAESYSETIGYEVENLFPGWTRDNYDFLYWVDPLGNVYRPGQTYALGGNITLTGAWSRQTVSRFYWTGSDSGDSAVFASGLDVSDALTAARFNRLSAKIAELASRLGWDYDYDDVYPGDEITAEGYSGARNGIGNLTAHGTLPPARARGDIVSAALFNGSASLKSALNTAIDNYNND